MIQNKSNQKGRDNQSFHVKHRSPAGAREESRGAAKASRTKQQLVCGLRPVMEAIDSGQQIDKILIQNGLDGSLMQELRAKIKEQGLPMQYVPAEKLDRMTDSNHQGVVATISPIRYHDFMGLLDSLLAQEKIPFIVMLDHLTDVRNVGAIVRTAECAGVDAVVVPDHGSAQISEDAIKSSSGALLRVPICRENNMKTVVNYARQSGLQVVAASEKGATGYVSVDFTLPTLLIMGSEDTGISPELLKMTDCRAKLPMRGEVQSLNVSVAAGIFFYEMVRQRNLRTL